MTPFICVYNLIFVPVNTPYSVRILKSVHFIGHSLIGSLFIIVTMPFHAQLFLWPLQNGHDISMVSSAAFG